MPPSQAYKRDKAETPLLFFDCLHPSVRGRLDVAAVEASFTILHRILSNAIAHPNEGRFARINTTSRRWLNDVLPFYYSLRLREWLGRRSAASSGEYLELAIDDAPEWARKMDELTVVRLAWGPEASESQNNDRNAPDDRLVDIFSHTTAEGVLQGLLRPPPQGMLPPLEKAAWEGGKRLMRLFILRDRLQSMRNDSSSSHSSGAEGQDESRIKPFADVLEGCIAAEWGIIGCNPDFERFCRVFSADLAPVVSIPILEECLNVIDTTQKRTADDEQTPISCAPQKSPSGELIASPSSSWQRQTQNEVRRRIAERHRAGYLLDIHQDLRSRTGEAYCRLSLEEQRCGVSLILDIAAFIEQVAIVEETQTLLRKDRLEARRLLEQFTQDGDLASLHALRDCWDEKLEAAKTAAGNQTVFLN
ncbi:unnamed protein product [Phytomonas sp. Hart1]|nr:unnamed protein product [Phytomonas sp. Hart1]|eukprot:CCW70905.1 unnamed protein product [Phytomonas sp. isolate Hart1]